ncbi:pyridoxal-dependent decarboxylase, exosortase system type 1 associated [Geobacter metallireducens RCH3]|uniref:Decarboxylase, BtrK-related protein n=1 Tax=Geobacter metallireducens (strain ATCC 53774 / DSM 7210 / GS-15) TaxID=269799 RepID=Q39U26_GEOMG|nr:pyridoxal-dependent decarboxylase, exosortase A system-associated [Geobacter metallireducens]ABB32248.1 decarboxylase, BtrK-related protein [Geobacter metallireducens GS-15]EHP86984.1 pyridoxal-dependent decarboxylase, exosortase system type 1 associated [Geobacter metallireducens RCH3]
MILTEQNGKTCLRNICFEELAARYGTPFYLYDLDKVKEKCAAVRKAFGDSLELLYAVKANPNRELLAAMRGEVDGLDIASAGELERALETGYDAGCISFAGPGKTRDELRRSLEAGVGCISVESLRELNDLRDLVRAGSHRAYILVRVNPQLLIRDFAVKMGGKASQFGIDEEELPSALDFIKANADAFDFKGIHIYAGTQCLNEEALAQNLANTLAIAARITTDYGMECRVINIGGGLGVSYYEEHPGLDLDKLALLFRAEFDRYREATGTKPRILLELGRFLVAEAGIYVTRVVSEKLSRGEQFYVLDGGMNHHLSASGNLGMTIRKNYLVRNLSRPGAERIICTLVGPLCTPLDLMGKGVTVEVPEVGDLVGFLNSGSYGYSASPLLFLGHGEPCELLVEGKDVRPCRLMGEMGSR